MGLHGRHPCRNAAKRIRQGTKTKRLSPPPILDFSVEDFVFSDRDLGGD